MLTWLEQNLGTLAIGLILLGIVALIVWKMAKDQRGGKASCGCGCAHCAMRGQCHKQES